MKKNIVYLLLTFTLSYIFPVNADDAYINGFDDYAKTLNKLDGSDDIQKSIISYKTEFNQVLKKEGYIGKLLALPKAIKVAEGVYTVVGSLIWHHEGNFGLNNNLTFIIFKDGVFVFNAGANPAIAYSFHQQIKKITDKPVKWVAVENSQGHAYLGSSYWVAKGVKNLYSHSVANDDFHNSFDFIKKHWGDRVGKVITADALDVSDKFTTFDDKIIVNVGDGETVEIMTLGPGHTPGSTVVYIPKRNIVLSGDLAFNKRMLALFDYTDTKAWMKTFEVFMDIMPKNVIVIPGHGDPTNMQTVKTDTYDYLKFLHKKVQAVVDNGGSQADAESIDQSTYKNRPVYQQTHKSNAVHVYKEIKRSSFEKK